MGKKKSLKERKQPRFIAMMVLTGTYFFVELILGLVTGSLALLSDAFHMLSDELSLFIGFYAIRFSKRAQSDIMTFGWARAEIVGALINGVFLLALCFMIFIEAMHRFFDPSEITDPMLVLIVGGVGLLINIIGLFLFMGHGHGHSHGGHGHSHGGHGHAKKHKNKDKKKKKAEKNHQHDHEHGEHEDEHEHEHEHEHAHKKKKKNKNKHAHDEHEHDHEHVGHDHDNEERHKFEDQEPGYEVEHQEFANHEHDHEHGHGHDECKEKEHDHDHDHDHGHEDDEHEHEHEHDKEHHSHNEESKKKKKKLNLNMHGVFLHVLGDALGSIIVMIVGGVLVAFPDFEGAPYLDPALSILIVFIIMFSTIPLVKQSTIILLQSVPQGISMPALEEQLRKIGGVQDVHELHLWQLTHEKFVGSCHLICDSAVAMMEVGSKAKLIFHDHGIHATTVQTEYKKLHLEQEDSTDMELDSDCQLLCKTKDCQEKMCCSKTLKKRAVKSRSQPNPQDQIDSSDKGRLDLFSKEV